MNSVIELPDSRIAPSLRLPVYPIADLVGVSFKHEHLSEILIEATRNSFFEVHAENYMGAGGPPHHALEQIRRYEPVLVSEHLAWSTHETTYFNDLLPLPYTEATLRRVSEHIDEVQHAIRRQILLENPSTYVAFRESTMSETDFIRGIVQRTGCRLLLDVNNVFVSATNHGYSARKYLSDFPIECVGEIHLAGHAEQTDDEGDRLLIDSHDGPVADAVWKLFEMVLSRSGPIPTLVEWDSNIPEWPVLKAEAAAAREILDQHSTSVTSGKVHAHR